MKRVFSYCHNYVEGSDDEIKLRVEAKIRRVRTTNLI